MRYIALAIISFVLSLITATITQATKVEPPPSTESFRILRPMGSNANPTLNPPGLDPGVRGGAPGAGAYLPGLSADELAYANAAGTWYAVPWSVSGNIVGEPIPGLGPAYDAVSCATCHSQPVQGGSSPDPNNLVAGSSPMIHFHGATNPVDVSGSLQTHGPTRIPYQVSTGSILKWFSIQGRTDAPGCTFPQPNFPTLLANNDLSYHISVPGFGLGLVESTPSENLISAQLTLPGGVGWTFNSLGITAGRFNHSVDGISTIGWKGGASSISWFAALALAVEMDVSSSVFPRKIDETLGCQFNGLPEDKPRLIRFSPPTSSISADYADMVTLTSQFLRYLAPPTPVTSYTSPIVGSVTSGMIANGQAKFIEVGCVACHTQSHTTGASNMTNQSNLTYNNWSDLALHDMGIELRDGLSFGQAGPQDYRTPSLWGMGQRIFFLHDGHETDLNIVIQDHSSTGSEANQVVINFNNLSTPDQQDILNFLRSL